MPRTFFFISSSFLTISQSLRIQSWFSKASWELPLITKPSYFSRSFSSGNSPETTLKESQCSPSSPNVDTNTLWYPPYVFFTNSESRVARNRQYFFCSTIFSGERKHRERLVRWERDWEGNEEETRMYMCIYMRSDLVDVPTWHLIFHVLSNSLYLFYRFIFIYLFRKYRDK